jgi:hypothetical protein
MSDVCCGGPNYFGSTVPFNASQVRLYGLPGEAFPFEANEGEKAAARRIDILDTFNSAVRGALVPRPSALVRMVTSRADQFVGVMSIGGGPGPGMTIGIIYGYAYEGHCYDLPKPKIMLIPALPQDVLPGDCAYDRKGRDPNGATAYKVWIVDKLDQCIDIDVSQGQVEELVLEANLPGKRSPTMYAAKAQLAHRNGRLTD